MNLDDFSTVVDDRRYVNPQVSLDEQNTFIDNLRTAQGARTTEIAQDTYNLGTAVPSNLGGLSGAGSYFTSRYQTPQTNAMVADLRAAAQAQALSDAMNNEIAQAKQRYSNAYKAYQKRHGGNNPANPANPTNPDDDPFNENPDNGNQSIWSDSTIRDDAAFYGLYRLARNKGESDQDWYARAKQWIEQQSAKKNVKEGGLLGKQPTAQQEWTLPTGPYKQNSGLPTGPYSSSTARKGPFDR